MRSEHQDEESLDEDEEDQPEREGGDHPTGVFPDVPKYVPSTVKEYVDKNLGGTWRFLDAISVKARETILKRPVYHNLAWLSAVCGGFALVGTAYMIVLTFFVFMVFSLGALAASALMLSAVVVPLACVVLASIGSIGACILCGAVVFEWILEKRNSLLSKYRGKGKEKLAGAKQD